MNKSWQERLAQGMSYESGWVEYLRGCTYDVVPSAYENTTLILPDLLVAGPGPWFWIEAKAKKKMARYDLTGFSEHYWRNYCQVQQESGFPVLISFLDEGVAWANWLNALEPQITRMFFGGKTHVLFPAYGSFHRVDPEEPFQDWLARHPPV